MRSKIAKLRCDRQEEQADIDEIYQHIDGPQLTYEEEEELADLAASEESHMRNNLHQMTVDLEEEGATDDRQIDEIYEYLAQDPRSPSGRGSPRNVSIWRKSGKIRGLTVDEEDNLAQVAAAEEADMRRALRTMQQEREAEVRVNTHVSTQHRA